MTPDLWKKCRDIFHKAVGVSPEARSEYISAACAGDTLLFSVITGMLRANVTEWTLAASDAQLSDPGIQWAQVAPRLEAVGLHVQRVIGSGGMGIVVLAKQEMPPRMVAVKMVKLTDRLTDTLIRRFEREIRVLAALNHPGIACIYGAGVVTDTPLGPCPWFSMEYLEGALPVTDFARANRLEVRARMKLLGEMMKPLMHAHMLGIAHRDLKPSNILVDSRGVVKIVDFGLAIRDEMGADPLGDLSITGQPMGSYPYLSPEQACGAAKHFDVRTDVYGAGAVAYELLGERPPFEANGRNVEECYRELRERDPVPLGRLRAHLRGDVESIVAKALSKNKSDRYQSLGEMDQDIKRYLVDEPVLARMPGVAYRTKKWLRRNRVITGALSIIVLALVIAIASTQYSLGVERRRRASAQASASLNESINSITQNILLSASPDVALGKDLTVRTVLDSASSTIDDIARDQPLVEAGVRVMIGRSYASLSLYAESLDNLRRAADKYERVLGAEDPYTLLAKHNVGAVLAEAGKQKEAEAILAEVLDKRQRLLGAMHSDTLTTMNSLAAVFKATGRLETAEKMFRAVVDGRQEIKGRLHPETITAMNNLAATLADQRKDTEAEAVFRQLLEVQSKAWPANDPRRSSTMHNLAAAIEGQGRLAEAITQEREVLSMQRAVLGERHRDTLRTMSNLGEWLTVAGQVDEAIKLLDAASSTGSDVLGRDHPEVLLTRMRLTDARRAAGRADGAIHEYREILEVQEACLGRAHRDTWATRARLSAALIDAGQLDQAEECVLSVWNERENADANAAPFVLSCGFNLGLGLLNLGRLVEAEPILRECVSIGEERVSSNEVGRATYRAALGECLLKVQQEQEGEALLRDAYEVFTEQLGKEHRSTRRVARSLAALYESRGDPQRAAMYRTEP